MGVDTFYRMCLMLAVDIQEFIVLVIIGSARSKSAKLLEKLQGAWSVIDTGI